MEIKTYQNYHKHTHYSSIITPDSNAKIEDYLKRIKELGYGSYFSLEHGYGGDIYEARTLCDKYGIKCIYGIEGYIVKDPLEKDRSNYHIVIIPTTNIARKKLNKASSRANKEGYYYKPRLFIEDLLKFDKDELYITTACLAGIISDENAINDIFIPLLNHFGDNVFLEVQSHNNEKQKSLNKLAVELSKKHNLKLIAANDSHYIYDYEKEDRNNLLLGKKMNYGDEDEFILDFPDYDTFYQRFIKQDILTPYQIEEAIKNTLIFDNCEEIIIHKNIKMPSLYLDKTKDERLNILANLIKTKFKNIIKEDNIKSSELPKYIEEINKEFQVIKDTKELDTADYFLFNDKLIELALNKYGGKLTKTGRGSSVSYYINRILGITHVDRIKSDVELYPERFMSTARLLENHALPDIDNNIENQEPFVKAAKELLGETGVYPMLAYGTLQEGEAFRNLCRAKNIDFEDFNEVAKDIEKYKDTPKWKNLYEESKKFINTIVSCSVHPCAFLLFSGDIESEIGVIKVGEYLCATITSDEADEYKYLKDDFLIVTVVKLINDTFKLIDKPVLSINELINNLDDKVWKLYEEGLTCTLNQVDGDWATSLVKQYKPKSVREMSMFVACLRPSFNSWRDDFISRKPYTTGSKYLDKILEPTDGYILYQESLMTFFQWLDITPAESISLIKKISKKKIKEEDFIILEDRLLKSWINKTGSKDLFEETWELVQKMTEYGFAASHSLCVALDSLYSAYLKANYPLEYYTIALIEYQDDQERTKKLTQELEYFGIKILSPKFGKSKGKYHLDKSTNSIYKGIGSIKYLNSQIGDDLYIISQTNTFKDFPMLLKAIQGVLNSKQLEILIKLDYFSDFGKARKLLNYNNLFIEFNGKKQIKKEGKDYSLSVEEIAKYCEKETVKQYGDFDYERLLLDQWKELENKSMPLIEILKTEKEYLGYIQYTNKKVKDLYFIEEFKVYKAKNKPYLSIYSIEDGITTKCRIKNGDSFSLKPFKENSLIFLDDLHEEYKYKWVTFDEEYLKKHKTTKKGELVKTQDKEWVLGDWRVVTL